MTTWKKFCSRLRVFGGIIAKKKNKFPSKTYFLFSATSWWRFLYDFLSKFFISPGLMRIPRKEIMDFFLPWLTRRLNRRLSNNTAKNECDFFAWLFKFEPSSARSIEWMEKGSLRLAASAFQWRTFLRRSNERSFALRSFGFGLRQTFKSSKSPWGAARSVGRSACAYLLGPFRMLHRASGMRL